MSRVEVRRGADRFVSHAEGRQAWHSFSFGPHYDPGNVGFGPLVAVNEFVLAPGAGFDPHMHAEVEIVSWVLDGTLAHEDDAGHRGVLTPGVAQWLTAGTGVRHSEANASTERPLHLLQMWVQPERTGRATAYELRDVTGELEAGGLIEVVSPRPGATLHAGRLHRGERVTLPGAAALHVSCLRGAVDLDGTGRLDAGDSARLVGATAAPVVAVEDSEILVWALDDPPG